MTVESIDDSSIRFDIINGGIIINASHEIKPIKSNSLRCKIGERLYVKCYHNDDNDYECKEFKIMDICKRYGYLTKDPTIDPTKDCIQLIAKTGWQKLLAKTDCKNCYQKLIPTTVPTTVSNN